MEENQEKGSGNKNTMIMVVAVVILVIVIAAGFVFLNKKQEVVQTANQTPTSSTNATETPSSAASNYKDGKYSAEGSYTIHAGTEKIGVALTLAKGVITEVNVTPEAVRPMSKQVQADFAAHYKEFVLGKNIDEVKLGKVSGSSLTPNGFNAAIDDIKSQAKS